MVYTVLLALLVAGAVRAQTLELRAPGQRSGYRRDRNRRYRRTRRYTGERDQLLRRHSRGCLRSDRGRAALCSGTAFGSGGGISQRDDGRGDWGAGGDGAIALCGGAWAGCRAGAHGGGGGRSLCPAVIAVGAAGDIADQHGDIRGKTGPRRRGWGTAFCGTGQARMAYRRSGAGPIQPGGSVKCTSPGFAAGEIRRR